jgi:hypothetical protein
MLHKYRLSFTYYGRREEGGGAEAPHNKIHMGQAGLRVSYYHSIKEETVEKIT